HFPRPAPGGVAPWPLWISRRRPALATCSRTSDPTWPGRTPRGAPSPPPAAPPRPRASALPERSGPVPHHSHATSITPSTSDGSHLVHIILGPQTRSAARPKKRIPAEG